MILERFVKTNKTEFLNGVAAMAARLNLNPNWIMAVMYVESGLNEKARNTKYLVGGFPATGLIQFVVFTAGELFNANYNAAKDKAAGYPLGAAALAKLYAMSNVQQLVYVEKYLSRYASKIKSFGDAYLAVFYPAYVGKPDATTFPSFVLRSNPYIDLNKNGVLTVGEFRKWAGSRIPTVDFLEMDVLPKVKEEIKKKVR